jgi:hypothetical protein
MNDKTSCYQNDPSFTGSNPTLSADFPLFHIGSCESSPEVHQSDTASCSPSLTPETDAKVEEDGWQFKTWIKADFARKLERERNEEMGFRGQWCDKARKAEAALDKWESGAAEILPPGANPSEAEAAKMFFDSFEELKAELAAARKALMACDGAMIGKVKPSSVAFKLTRAILYPENVAPLAPADSQPPTTHENV